MIAYRKYPKESILKLLELRREFRKVAEYTKTSCLFLRHCKNYTNTMFKGYHYNRHKIIIK